MLVVVVAAAAAAVVVVVVFVAVVLMVVMVVVVVVLRLTTSMLRLPQVSECFKFSGARYNEKAELLESGIGEHEVPPHMNPFNGKQNSEICWKGCDGWVRNQQIGEDNDEEAGQLHRFCWPLEYREEGAARGGKERGESDGTFLPCSTLSFELQFGVDGLKLGKAGKIVLREMASRSAAFTLFNGMIEKLKTQTDAMHRGSKRESEDNELLRRRVELAVREKDEMAKRLYAKFALLLNEKKRKISELEDEVRALSNSSGGGGGGGGDGGGGGGGPARFVTPDSPEAGRSDSGWARGGGGGGGGPPSPRRYNGSSSASGGSGSGSGGGGGGGGRGGGGGGGGGALEGSRGGDDHTLTMSLPTGGDGTRTMSLVSGETQTMPVGTGEDTVAAGAAGAMPPPKRRRADGGGSRPTATFGSGGGTGGSGSGLPAALPPSESEAAESQGSQGSIEGADDW